MRAKLNLSEFLAVPELPELLAAVEDQLLLSVKSDNNQIHQPIFRLINAGGKRLRPALVIACAAINKDKIDKKVIRLASAVELLHIGSLVHDDIIDEADTRWNVDTINNIEGLNQAIVIGDYLLATACAQAATVSKKAAKIVADTIVKLCDGQNRELAFAHNLNRTQESMLKAIEGKTAALISSTCELGGMCANLSAKQLKSLSEFGHNFGIAFQLIDDLMDLVSTEQLYGKPIGTDIIEGVYTLPVILGLNSPNSNKIKKLVTSKTFDPELIQLLFDGGAIKETIVQIKKHNYQASQALNEFNSPVGQALRKLPANYFEWTLDNLIAKAYSSKMQKM